MQTDAADRKRKFLKALSGQPALDLMGFLPDTYFWIKDARGRFMAANPAFVKGCGLKDEAELIGKTDLDVWPRHLAEAYRRDDAEVMRTGRPIVNKLELSRNAVGGADWFCTTKIALRGRDGSVRGTAGFGRDVKKAHDDFKPYMELSGVIEHILAHYSEALPLKDLAARAAMSASQFERKFKKHFGATPTAYVRAIRIRAACRFLAETDLPVAQVAFRTGHYDHSHFHRCFRAETGMSATAYRAKVRPRPGH